MHYIGQGAVASYCTPGKIVLSGVTSQRKRQTPDTIPRLSLEEKGRRMDINLIQGGDMRCLLLLSISVSVYAQSYVLTKSTFSNAGGSLSSANYILSAAAGQSVTGVSNNTAYIEQAGFYTYSELRQPGIEETETRLIPRVFNLFQPYPNPTVNGATIKYRVPRLNRVSIKVYDVSGRVVKTLVHSDKKPGFYSLRWDGTADNGSRVAQGIYFVRMLAPDFRATKKIVVLK